MINTQFSSRIFGVGHEAGKGILLQVCRRTHGVAGGQTSFIS